jgi:hypothetical protein
VLVPLSCYTYQVDLCPLKTKAMISSLFGTMISK